MVDWRSISVTNGLTVSLMIMWSQTYPGATARYRALGLSWVEAFIAVRAAPMAGIRAEAAVAALGTRYPSSALAVLREASRKTTVARIIRARDDAVMEGLGRHAPRAIDLLADFGAGLWEVAGRLPREGRICFSALVTQPRPDDPALSGWYAVDCLRQWREDTMWSTVAASGLTAMELGILEHRPGQPVARQLARYGDHPSRALASAWSSLESGGLVDGCEVTAAGGELMAEIDERVILLFERPWRLLGEEESVRFVEWFRLPVFDLVTQLRADRAANKA